MDELNEQQQQRIKKLEPCAKRRGAVRHSIRRERPRGSTDQAPWREDKETLEQEKISCTFAGRIVALRRFGKAGFAVLQDGSDRLQVYFKKDHLL